ncbi:Protein of unknown function DUF262 [Opitutaceae bacterium TAV1]|nr:Protein of unknown function DUF262 [Opitutaceae bacterium TAV1]
MTFLELIAATPHGVEIPLLQRDYAQGRDADAPRVKQVRNAFLDALHVALAETENKPAHLDFIYGEVRDDAFEPIDGQQRLTTLFLLHWYLAAIGERGKAFCDLLHPDRSGRPRFRYAMRPITERFFVRLLAGHDLPKPENNKAAPKQWVSAHLQDQAWFIGDWLHDPSVAGALVMLDAIAEKFGHDPGTCEELYKKLTEDNAPITFNLLKLSSIGQGDEIYVKMNARGKPLTDFEKFKAWLIGNHADALSKEQKQKLDNDWLEFFWRHSPKKGSGSKSDASYDRAGHVSRVFFRTVLALAVNYHAKEESTDEQVASWIEKNRTPRLEESRDKWNQLFTKKTLEHVFSSLEQLGKLPFEAESLSIPNLKFFDPPAAFLTHDAAQPPELGMRLWLHALGLFVEHFKDASAHASQEAQEWLRVIRNLLEHTEPEAKNYARIIRGLDTLAGRMKATPANLSEIDDRAISGLDQGQLKEEARKAKLRRDNSEWKKLLNDAEDHDLLRGQIEFLLGDETAEKSTLCVESFTRRWQNFERLFPACGQNRSDVNLIRKALARCEPISLHGPEELVLPHGDAEWRNIFQRCTGVRNAFQRGCFRLVDAVSASATTSKTCDSSWMGTLIQHGEELWTKHPCKKVRSYYSRVFLYKNPSHRNDWHDLAIDEFADLRNRLVEVLCSSGWVFPNAGEQDKRRIKCKDGTVFYKGHEITLRLKADESIECIFGYDKLTLRLTGTDNAPDIKYPDDASLAAFATSLENETKARIAAAPEDSLTVALAKLAELAGSLATKSDSLNISCDTPSITPP